MHFKHIFFCYNTNHFSKRTIENYDSFFKIYLFNFCNLGHPNAYYTLMQYTHSAAMQSTTIFGSCTVGDPNRGNLTRGFLEFKNI